MIYTKLPNSFPDLISYNPSNICQYIIKSERERERGRERENMASHT